MCMIGPVLQEILHIVFSTLGDLVTYLMLPNSLSSLTIRETGFLANSEHPDEMPHKAAFHQGLHCWLI